MLFTTGYTRNAIVHHGVLDPGVHVLIKPYTFEALATKVQELLLAAKANLEFRLNSGSVAGALGPRFRGDERSKGGVLCSPTTKRISIPVRPRESGDPGRHNDSLRLKPPLATSLLMLDDDPMRRAVHPAGLERPGAQRTKPVPRMGREHQRHAG